MVEIIKVGSPVTIHYFLKSSFHYLENSYEELYKLPSMCNLGYSLVEKIEGDSIFVEGVRIPFFPKSFKKFLEEENFLREYVGNLQDKIGSNDFSIKNGFPALFEMACKFPSNRMPNSAVLIRVKNSWHSYIESFPRKNIIFLEKDEEDVFSTERKRMNFLKRSSKNSSFLEKLSKYKKGQLC